MNGQHTVGWRTELMSFGLVAFAGFLTSLTQTNDRPASHSIPQVHDGLAARHEFPDFGTSDRASSFSRALKQQPQ
jgi:hypothetical protein